MQEEIRNCGCNDGCGCNNNSVCNNNCGCGNNGGFLSNFFGGCGCNGDSEILFFIIIFLLLFTNFGCGCCRG